MTTYYSCKYSDNVLFRNFKRNEKISGLYFETEQQALDDRNSRRQEAELLLDDIEDALDKLLALYNFTINYCSTDPMYNIQSTNSYQYISVVIGGYHFERGIEIN